MSDEPPRRQNKLIRPYVITQGRTRASGVRLALEAPVRANSDAAALAPDATPESLRIVALCAEPMSLAELAARLTLPVGVVRVLVADLSASGVVSVGEAVPPEAATDVRLLERLLDGIRAL
jgi:hypothetical protein